jgi:hypothetical protein
MLVTNAHQFIRLNVEHTESELRVCFGNHEKGHPCVYETMTPEQTHQLIEDAVKIMIGLTRRIEHGSSEKA